MADAFALVGISALALVGIVRCVIAFDDWLHDR